MRFRTDRFTGASPTGPWMDECSDIMTPAAQLAAANFWIQIEDSERRMVPKVQIRLPYTFLLARIINQFPFLRVVMGEMMPVKRLLQPT